MSSLDRATVRRAFALVEEAPPHLRPQLLADLPEPIRAEVQSLLDALEQPLHAALADAPQPGAHIGPYELHEVLGQGGMGIVFRAERRDGEFQREVALKIAGGRMFAPEAQRRFIAERQILAQLDHPNIVRLLDGGVFRGQRYFVMELVRGLPITDYARSLPIRERLRLFLQVCAAVQRAHENLILHRDLKSGNILVTREGIVKVLDFGIARLVTDDDALQPQQHTAAHPFSLACASPEQIRGEPLSLASDIYALGLLLYELVTGENPQLRNGSSLQHVLESAAEPPKALSLCVKDIGRDLDAIAWKALAKAPRDRYSSAADLDRDVRNYLAGRPVSAVPPSLLYRATRFLHRNRALSLMTAAALAATITGAALYVRESRSEQRRFEQARRLVRTVVFDIQPKLASIPATLPLRKTLIDETLRYLEGLSQDTGRDAGLIIEIARAYLELARIQGPGNGASIGDHAGAVHSFARARDMSEAALALRPDDYEFLLSAAAIRQNAAAYLSEVDLPTARADSDRGTQLAKRAADLRPNERRSREAYAFSLFSRAGVLRRTDFEASAAAYEQAGELYKALARDYPIHRRNVALMDRYRADIFLQTGKNDQALACARNAFRISEQLLAEAPGNATAQFDFGIDASQLGETLSRVEPPAAALPYFEKAVRLREKILAADPANIRARERTASGLASYGKALLHAGSLPEARQALTRSTQLYANLLAQGRLDLAALRGAIKAQDSLGELEWRQTNRPAACRAFNEAANLAAQAQRSGASIEKSVVAAVTANLQRCRDPKLN